MKCVVTAGPTYEPLDEVRRLTNFSTGKLGTDLAEYLIGRGHEVILLRGYYALYQERPRTDRVITFTTTADLSMRLAALAGEPIQAVFHTAAVNDFAFGAVWKRTDDGQLTEIKSGKFSTAQGPLLAELVATPKLIRELRRWFPRACLVGWKFEVEGDRLRALAQGERQRVENQTSACVVNGRAYGHGFGLVTGAGEWTHQGDSLSLYAALEEWVCNWVISNACSCPKPTESLGNPLI